MTDVGERHPLRIRSLGTGRDIFKHGVTSSNPKLNVI